MLISKKYGTNFFPIITIWQETWISSTTQSEGAVALLKDSNVCRLTLSLNSYGKMLGVGKNGYLLHYT